MDSRLVEMLENHRLSTARRLFVLEQMLTRAEARSPGDLVSRIERLIEANRRILRREMIRQRRPQPPSEQSRSRIDDASQRAHRRFAELGRHILQNYSPSTAHYLLMPAQQQFHRLQNFAARTDGVESPSCDIDESADPHQPSVFVRTST